MNKFTFDPSRYTHFRPSYPDKLFAYLSNLVGDDVTVLECGAGSGQATQGLSRYFKNIVSTELSNELLSNAPILSNVYYIQSSAEQLPVRSNSVNLICVAQAMHWFLLDDFYSEVNRILRPSGIMAAWCYNQAMIEPAIDNAINKIYKQITSELNYSRERKYLYDHYQSMPFPFARIIAPAFTMRANWSLNQLFGYINTWPGLLEYQKNYGINLLSEIEEELIAVWGEPALEKLITWPIYLLVGRKV